MEFDHLTFMQRHALKEVQLIGRELRAMSPEVVTDDDQQLMFNAILSCMQLGVPAEDLGLAIAEISTEADNG